MKLESVDSMVFEFRTTWDVSTFCSLGVELHAERSAQTSNKEIWWSRDVFIEI